MTGYFSIKSTETFEESYSVSYDSELRIVVQYNVQNKLCYMTPGLVTVQYSSISLDQNVKTEIKNSFFSGQNI